MVGEIYVKDLKKPLGRLLLLTKVRVGKLFSHKVRIIRNENKWYSWCKREKKKQIFCQKIVTCKIVYPEEPFGVHACLFWRFV